MTEPLIDCPADILRQLLVDMGIAVEPTFGSDGAYTGGRWPAFANTIPSRPDEIIIVTDTDDQDDGPDMHSNLYFHFACQVRLRSKTEQEGRLKGYAVQAAIFDGVNVYDRSVTIPESATTYQVHCVIPGPLIAMGMGIATDKRFNFSINVLMPIKKL